VGFSMAGFEAMEARLREILGRVETATPAAIQRAGFEVQREAQRLLALSSHPPGTPTPSAPGQPPSLISGALRRSIEVGQPELRDGGWSIEVGPTIVYGRIQEFGGTAGNGATLPPRPYMRPAWAVVTPKIKDILEDAWSNAVN
jgi:phage gpG-like protein